MNEQLRKLWKIRRKPIVAVLFLLFAAVGILIYINLGAKEKPVEVALNTAAEDTGKYEEVQPSTEPQAAVAATPAVTRTPIRDEENAAKEETKNNPTKAVSKPESKSTKEAIGEKQEESKADNKNSDVQPETKKQQATPTASPTSVPTSKPQKEPTANPLTVTPVQESKYIPIPEGWKASKSAKGDITTEQKDDLDNMVESWQGRAVSDEQLKEDIIAYLDEQGIGFIEVSVTSRGYALYDKIPEIDLRDGGNLYSFVGTYSTGKQNPEGTDKTVCYNWSAFVF